MTIQDILHLRRSNLCLASNQDRSISELFLYLGAMQAQDLRMSKLAIALRTHARTKAEVEAAINRGDIIRTHILRPTWHFVAAENLRWMLQLTAPRIKASMRSRHRQLEIDEEAVKQSNSIIEQALLQGNALDREALLQKLSEANIVIAGNRGYHLLLRAELDALICSGPLQDGKHTYALMDERVPPSDPIPDAEAVIRLARLYFHSHGPARLKDFIWWSGLTTGMAKKALSTLEKELLSVQVEGESYWMAETDPSPQVPIQLLPAYDEFLIGYQDKSFAVAPSVNPKRIFNSGVFRPMLLVDGRVAGIWKLDTSRKQSRIQVELLAEQMRVKAEDLNSDLQFLERFWGGSLELSIQNTTR